jgi:hypothetical protein
MSSIYSHPPVLGAKREAEALTNFLFQFSISTGKVFRSFPIIIVLPQNNQYAKQTCFDDIS